MKTMVKQLLLILILLPLTTFGQQTEKYVSDYASFYRAEELYEKAQYSAAREEFRGFINQFKNENDPLYVKALYYEGISALELFNNDAIPLLQAFNKKYPENIYKYIIGFKIGNYFFQKEDFLNAQVWYQKVPVNEVDKTQQEEFLFKLGYSAMQNADNETAFSAFRDAKDGKSQYAAPSLYFYSHLSYLKNSLSVALEGFLKLKSDSTFSAVVPYYIVQIYHKQAKYQEVVDFAPSVVTANELNNEADINHIIGNSHYKLGNFKEAIPYLEKYQAKAKVKRDDSYELGYCYYKTNQYFFDKIYYIKKIPLFEQRDLNFYKNLNF
jgi:tetratricopeptide (TPR) repeat protein